MPNDAHEREIKMQVYSQPKNTLHHPEPALE